MHAFKQLYCSLQVHPDQLADIAAVLFCSNGLRTFAHLAAAAVAVLPAPEQRMHYDVLSMAGMAAVKASSCQHPPVIIRQKFPVQ